MGVSLSSLVEGKEIDFAFLSGKTIAIDGYNTLYQFLSIIRDRFTGEPLRDSQGRITSHLSGLFYRTSKLVEGGITPIFVFDGKPPEFKKATIDGRVKIRDDAETKWKEALKKGDAEKARMYAQGASKLTKEMVEEAKILLGYMGVSWVQAPSEGEAQATHMVKRGQAYAVGSQDWDSLLFGAERAVRNLTLSGKRKVARKEQYVEVVPELITLHDVLKTLGIGYEQLILLGMLIGTDYNPGGVKGVGPKTALKLVKEHKNLEGLLRYITWECAVPAEKIFDFFLHPPAEDVAIVKQKLEPEKILSFLREHDFSQERIENVAKKLSQVKDEQKQKGLGGFFGH